MKELNNHIIHTILFVRSGLEGGGGGGGSGCCSESVGVLLEGLLEDTRDKEEPKNTFQ